MSEHRTITAMGGPFVTVGTSPSARGDRDMGLRICAGESSISAILSPDGARQLRDALTAWLDAPRLAARATAEVVAEEDGVRLLKTGAGEWGVGACEEEGGEDVEAIAWCDAGEVAARRLFDDMLERVTCDGCDKRVSVDDATYHGDGYYCEACADVARDAFQATRYRCDACKWSGTGADVSVEDDAALCPECSDFVVEVAP